jgi:phosphohistidine swiveling domain-containing protein
MKNIPNISEYKYEGLYINNKPFAGWFWMNWHIKDFARDVGLLVNFGGLLMLKEGHYFIHKKTLKEFKNSVQHYIENPPLGEGFVHYAQKTYDEAIEWADALDHSSYSDEETLKYIWEFGRKIIFFWCSGWILSLAFDHLAKESPEKFEILQSIDPKQIEANTPLSRQKVAMKRLHDLLQEKRLLQESINIERALEEHADIKDKLAAHVKDYEWVGRVLFSGEKFTLSKLLQQIKNVDSNVHDSDINLESTNPDEPVLRCAKTIAFLNQTGAEYFVVFSTKILPFLEKIAETANVDYNDLLYVLPSEIYTNGVLTINKDVISRRKKHRFVMYTDQGNKGQLSEDEEVVRDLEKFIPAAPETADEKILKGQIGYTGVVKGRVRVVISGEDFPNFRDGEILVTTMTTTDFIILMQRSSAVVTDMGGILSHAAIFSREMKKPCVIGTRFATKILKDGDMVEVDAEKGIVRIIEKNEYP